MTVRDDIYKKYQQWWEALMTLKWWMMPQFIEFVEHTTFEKKSVLDIGCGSGHYLVYLKTINFKIAGRDSSPTAVQMTKDALGDEGDITCADMYTTDVKPNTFDLIMSIRTIHHWSKQEVKERIDTIYQALMPAGKIFITLPDYDSQNNRDSFENMKEIAPGTFVPESWPELWLPHSFFTQDEIKELFKQFKNTTYTLDGEVQRIIIWEK